MKPATPLLSWLRRDRRRTVLAVGVALALAARAGLPWVLEWVLESQGAEQLGRSVAVEDVDLSVLAGGLTLEGLSVGSPHTADANELGDARLRSARVEARWSWLGLLRGEIHLEGLDFDTPQLVLVTRADGTLEPWLPAEAPESAPEQEPPDEAGDAGEGWPLRLDQLRLTELDVLYVNLARPDHRVLEFQMEEFALDGLLVDGADIALAGLAVRGPRLRVRRDIDLAPFTAPAPAGESAPAPEAEEVAASPLVYRVEKLSIERAAIALSIDDEREIETLVSFRARELSSAADARFPVEARLELEGGWFAVAGEAGLSPPAFDGRLTWDALPLEPFSAGASLPVHASAGATSGELELGVRAAADPDSEAARVDVSGRISVDGLDAAARDDSLALAWNSLEIELDALSFEPGGTSIAVTALRLQEPALRVTRRAGEPAAAPAEPAESAGFADDADPAQSSAGEGASPAPRLRLADLEVDGGAVVFEDESVSPTHRTELRDVRVRGRGLRWPERDARSLEVALRGPQRARAGLQASLRGGRGDVKLDLDEIDLTGFSVYAASAVGYELTGGTASLAARVGVAGDRYAIDSDLALDRFELAELDAGAFEKQFGVPLDLGLALLRDPKGRIALPIDAEVDRGESRVGLASLVGGALRQALLGALAAPLKGLQLVAATAKGAVTPKLPTLEAEPGAPVPDLEELPRFRSLLASRPELGLELRGRAGSADDPALAERTLIEAIRTGAEPPPVDAGFLQKRRLRAALEERGRGGTPEIDADDRQALERWIASVEVTDAARRDLARARAGAVRDALVGTEGIGPERLELGRTLEGAPGVVVSLTHVSP